MTFREYIGTIKKTKLFIGSREKIVIELFEAAGSKRELSEATAKSWMRDEKSKGHRECTIRLYFPDDKMDEDGFINFFSTRININTSWRRLQEAFQAYNSDNDCVVNLATDNAKVFYWSLLHQFQKIHRLPLTELPSNDMKLANAKDVLSVQSSNVFDNNENTAALQNKAASKSEQMRKTFEQAYHDSRISDFMNQNLSEGLNSDLLSLVDSFIKTIELTVNKIGPCDNREIIIQYYKTLSQYRDYVEKNILSLQNIFQKLIGVAGASVLGAGVLGVMGLGVGIWGAFAKGKDETDKYIFYRQKLEFLYRKISGNDSE